MPPLPRGTSGKKDMVCVGVLITSTGPTALYYSINRTYIQGKAAREMRKGCRGQETHSRVVVFTSFYFTPDSTCIYLEVIFSSSNGSFSYEQQAYRLGVYIAILE